MAETPPAKKEVAMTIIDDVEKEIKELESQIEKLKLKKQAKESLTDAQRLAILIHDVYDKHDDDVWDYNITDAGVPNFNKLPASDYLALANKQLSYMDAFMSQSDAYKVLKFIHESKRTLKTY